MHMDIDKLIAFVTAGDSIARRQESRFPKRSTGTYNFHNSGCIYEGEMCDGKAEGEGVVYYPNNYGVILYKGEFHNGNRHGMGTLYLEDGVTKCYEGQWTNDEMEGRGVTYWEDGVTKSYEGNLHDGYYEGEGTVYDKTGQKFYEGGFHKSDFHGKGAIYRNGMKLCEGDFSEGQMIRGALFKNGLKIYDGPLPPTEEGLIRTGARFNGALNDCRLVFRDYVLSLQDTKYKN